MTHKKYQDYTHPKLHEEITAVSGHYTLIKEARLRFHNTEILYYIGHAAFDTSCCGEGGCAYAFVAGFIHHWKMKKTKDGYDVSLLEKISDESDQKEIIAILKAKEGVHQISFN